MIIRPVEQIDCKILWQWRNHPGTRKMSLNTSEVLYEEHQSWFASVIRNPTKLILMGQFSEDERDNSLKNVEKRFATLRLDFSKSRSSLHYDQAIVSINVNPDYRGQSLAKPFLQQAFEWLKLNHQSLSLDFSNKLSIFATIKRENLASIKLFESLGFIKVKHESDEQILQYKLDDAFK